MKKIKKNLTCFIAAMIFICGNIYAISFDSSLFGTSSLRSELKKTIDLENEFIKKEEISTVEYQYPEKLENNFEKYITVCMNITYTEKITGKIFGILSAKSNFRYNTVTKRAQCLSTSCASVKNGEGYILDVFSRRSNTQIERGQSKVYIYFKFNGTIRDNVDYEFSCNFIGNVEFSC